MIVEAKVKFYETRLIYAFKKDGCWLIDELTLNTPKKLRKSNLKNELDSDFFENSVILEIESNLYNKLVGVEV